MVLSHTDTQAVALLARVSHCPSFMRISVFSHNSNPAIDPPLCRKGDHYVADLLARGDAIPLNPDNFSAGVKLLPPEKIRQSSGNDRVNGDFHLRSRRAPASITAKESRLNGESRSAFLEIKPNGWMELGEIDARRVLNARGACCVHANTFINDRFERAALKADILVDQAVSDQLPIPASVARILAETKILLQPVLCETKTVTISGHRVHGATFRECRA